MSAIKWLVGFLLLIFSVALAQAGDRAPRMEVLNDNAARIYNVRLEDKGLKLRGRVTRSNRDVKVPHGQVITVIYNAKGRELHTLQSTYKPRHVHRKKKRASYFTVHLPKDVDLHKSSIRIYYLSDESSRKRSDNRSINTRTLFEE
ncbi:hypothetical protein [Pontibacterium sp.]|uniref:hypothetical protein n=1 Tax=Pontibacterium sp. TaxID=2036026 RepID=UPI003518F159